MVTKDAARRKHSNIANARAKPQNARGSFTTVKVEGDLVGETKVVHLKTNVGTIVLELAADKAPKSVANFLEYVNEGFYEGTIFHRVIDNFVIQGGGFGPGMTQKMTKPPVQNEANNGLRNARGTVAMARTSDPHSATSQFFFNIVDNDFLNYTAPTPQGWGYCVFGKIIDGLNVLDQMKGVPTGSKLGHKDVPLTDIILEKVTVVS
jgi:peptidyl-prolyl cis-trans isomerase B (cyclophilin B)